MTWLVQSRLVNDPFSDPGLFIDFRFGRRGILFDLGDVAPLAARELMRVSHVFVSHAHMDHFAGFDRLLRLALHRTQPLHLLGPDGFIERVEAKLRAYTWNLLNADSIDFAILASEFAGDRISRRAAFRAREAFRRRDVEAPTLAPGIALDEDDFRVEAAVLDHGIPCLAFAFQERLRVNVLRDGLVKRGLPVGPWLAAAKSAVRRAAPDDEEIAVSADLSVRLGDLKDSVLRAAPGQRIAYVVDCAFTDRNVARIEALARGVDVLYVEAVFAQADAALAAAKFHLTAAQAGTIGRRAGAARLVPLHFSARYLGRPEILQAEVEAAFRGTESRAGASETVG